MNVKELSMRFKKVSRFPVLLWTVFFWLLLSQKILWMQTQGFQSLAENFKVIINFCNYILRCDNVFSLKELSHRSMFWNSGFKMLMKANIYTGIILGLRHEKQDDKLCYCCWKSRELEWIGMKTLFELEK